MRQSKLNERLKDFEEIVESQEWTTLPPICTVAFQTLFEALKIQSASIGMFEPILANSVAKEDLKKALQLKANLVDVEDSFQRIAEELDAKLGSEELMLALEDYTKNGEDAGKRAGNKDSEIKELDDRLTKIETLALQLDTDDQALSSIHYVKKVEIDLLKTEMIDSIESSLKEVYERLERCSGSLSKENTEKHFQDFLIQIEEQKRESEQKFNQLLDELETRPSSKEFSSLKRSLDLLLKDNDLANQAKGVSDKLIREQKEGIFNLSNQVQELMSSFSSLADRGKWLEGEVKEVSKQNSKVIEEMAAILVNHKALQHERVENSKEISALDNRIKKLDNANKTQQEILTLMSNRRVEVDVGSKSSGREMVSERNNSWVRAELEELKEYFEKKFKKVESSMVKPEVFYQLQDSSDAFQTDATDRLKKLKKMIEENSKEIVLLKETTKVKEKVPTVETPKGQTISKAVGQLISKHPVKPEVSVESGNSDKLKNLDNLIIKVSNFMTSKQTEEGQLKALEERLGSLEARIEEKADTKRTCKIMDKKAEIQDVNRALVEIHEELDSLKKTGKEKRKENASQSKEIGEVRPQAPAGIKGIWFWKKGIVAGNKCITWDVEHLNSSQNALVWDRNKTFFSVVEPGLYQVSVGVFGKTPPTQLSLLINEETVKEVDKKGDGKSQGMHSSGNVRGWAMTEYLILPPKASVSVMVVVGSHYDGFISIEKL